MHFTAAQMKDMRQKERDKGGEEFQRNHGKQTAGFIQQQFTSLSLSPLAISEPHDNWSFNMCLASYTA